MKIFSPVIFFAIFASLTETASATRWHVDSSSTPGGFGYSWPDAFHDLREALEVAEDGDEIWIAQGTYVPTPGTFFYSGDAYPLRFETDRAVTIRGGFLGSETVLSQRPPLDPAQTVLNGDLGGDDVTPGSNPSDNALQNLFIDIQDQKTVEIEGLTLQAAREDALLVRRPGFAENTKIIITHCRIEFCAGDGIECRGVHTTIKDTLIYANEGVGLKKRNSSGTMRDIWVVANTGAGIEFRKNAGGTLVPENEIIDSKVEFNGTNGIVDFSGDLILHDTVVQWNEANGILCLHLVGEESGSLEVSDSEIIGNLLDGIFVTRGGEVSLEDTELEKNKMGLRVSGTTITMRNTTFHQNALSGVGGAIIMRNGVSLTGNGVTISENGRGFSAGIRMLGFAGDAGCTVNLTNAKFLGNHKTALFIDAADDPSETHYVTLINPVFVGNVNPVTEGGAIRNGGNLQIFQGTFFGNEAVGEGDVIAANTMGTIPASTTFTQCIWYGNNASGGRAIALSTFNSVNNLEDIDPRFVRYPDSGDGDWTTTADNDYGDLNLSTLSPAVNAGDIRALPQDITDYDNDGDTSELIEFDAQKRNRVIALYPDLGAFESKHAYRSRGGR